MKSVKPILQMNRYLPFSPWIICKGILKYSYHDKQRSIITQGVWTNAWFPLWGIPYHHVKHKIKETGLQWTNRLVSKIISYQLEVYKGYYDKAVTSSRAVSCNACLEVSVDDFPLILQLKLPVVDRIHPQSNKFVTRYREQGYRWLKT